ncbi:hypothetical protein DQ237_03520 [Blastococcus sp. TF02-8]|uniref:hypothetical protein n=1 Tax=Blastococcus sp. TF02-8 TaxID=2250574 RepID=UPI000DE937B5|nr:hypothetical protein [Blastococcus sp. TF02-8]RBY97975.1 hypothetical protein DQ237_03520 [Blastococcus sp. TF02-8]
MRARSTTVQGDPKNLDKGIRYVSDRVLPAVMGMDGFIGLSMLADRHTGRCIITSAWEDTAALHRSATEVKAMRARAADILGGPATVDAWTIDVLHRLHPTRPGACTRVTWMRNRPQHLDGMIDAFGMSIVPRLADLPGFCAVSMLTNHDDGRSTAAVTYDTRDAMQASLDQVTELRRDFTRAVGAEVVEVATYDLVVAQLRVPETV